MHAESVSVDRPRGMKRHPLLLALSCLLWLLWLALLAGLAWQRLRTPDPGAAGVACVSDFRPMGAPVLGRLS
jgi:hypothetical protein